MCKCRSFKKKGIIIIFAPQTQGPQTHRHQNLREVGLQESREQRRWASGPKPQRKQKILEGEGPQKDSPNKGTIYSVSLEDCLFWHIEVVSLYSFAGAVTKNATVSVA